MSTLFRFPHAARRDPAVQEWLARRHGALGELATQWFEVIRGSGAEVRELLHDGHPTACVGDAAFAYVDDYREHVNLGFFRGAELPDPHGLLEGTGKLMRHVKLRPGREVHAAALRRLIAAAHRDMQRRVRAEDDAGRDEREA